MCQPFVVSSMDTVVNQVDKMPAYMEYIVRIQSVPKGQLSNPNRRMQKKKSNLLAKITEKFRGSTGLKRSWM